MLFFIHVMKTGGSTVKWQLRRANPGRTMYPTSQRDGDTIDANLLVAPLLGLDAERRAELRVVAGHYPWFATLAFPGARVATMLRHPVDRTISFLKHARLHHPGQSEMDLESLYADRFNRECFVLNHQTKVFALDPDDLDDGSQNFLTASVLVPVAMTQGRLDTAKERLAGVDLVGVHERHDAFVAGLAGHVGIDRREGERFRDSEPEPVPPSLVERILEDNQLDLDLWEWACELAGEGAVT